MTSVKSDYYLYVNCATNIVKNQKIAENGKTLKSVRKTESK
jgi:hypothetical protein